MYGMNLVKVDQVHPSYAH